jgi:hypothetical protein
MNYLRTLGYALYALCLCLLVFGGYIPFIKLAEYTQFETVIEVPEPLDYFVTEEELEALYYEVAREGAEEGFKNGDESTEEAEGPSSEPIGDDASAATPESTENSPSQTEIKAPPSTSSGSNNGNSERLSSSNGSNDKGGDDNSERTRPQKSTTPKKRDCKSNVKGIKKTGTNKYEIPGAIIDGYANDLKKAERLAVVAWSMKKGKKEGVRIKRIRCRSVLRDAGFKNGDVVLAVNDVPVDSMPKVLRAYFKLKRAERKLKVKVRRNGKIITLKYRLT